MAVPPPQATDSMKLLPEVCFEFPFILIGKLTIETAFSTGQSYCIALHGACSDLGTQVGAQKEDFGAVSPKDLTRV